MAYVNYVISEFGLCGLYGLYGLYVCGLFKYYSNKKKEKKNKNYIIVNANGWIFVVIKAF